MRRRELMLLLGGTLMATRATRATEDDARYRLSQRQIAR